MVNYADWPVNEADLHARHLWLVNREGFRERMKTDPDYFDAKIAGWWVWGISMWIGSGWCPRPEWRGRSGAERAGKGIHRSKLSRHTPLNSVLWQTRPNLGGNGVHRKLPAVGRGGERGVIRKRPQVKRGGNGVAAKDISARVHQMPNISGDAGASGRGVFANYAEDLYSYLAAIAHRMRRVRVCCGDWKRILGPSPTTRIGTTGVLLDPPYAVDDRSSIYNQEDFSVGEEVRQWAIENGDNPQLRIALCGYDDGRAMPAGWMELAWKANGGYANQSGETRGRKNASRERVWFSPHCLSFGPLFHAAQPIECVVKSNEKEDLTEKPEKGFLEPAPAAEPNSAAGVRPSPS